MSFDNPAVHQWSSKSYTNRSPIRTPELWLGKKVHFPFIYPVNQTPELWRVHKSALDSSSSLINPYTSKVWAVFNFIFSDQNGKTYPGHFSMWETLFISFKDVVFGGVSACVSLSLSDCLVNTALLFCVFINSETTLVYFHRCMA